MDWGEWDGGRSVDLRARYGEAFDRQIARGLDMHPHGGETPRALRTRVEGWLDRVRLAGRPAGAVCHQGVIRALLSLATGWNMIAKPPVELEWSAVQLFGLAGDGKVALERPNVMLDGGRAISGRTRSYPVAAIPLTLTLSPPGRGDALVHSFLPSPLPLAGRAGGGRTAST